MSSSPQISRGRAFVLLLGLDLDDQESSGYAFAQAARIGSRIPYCELHVVHVAPASASSEETARLAGLLRLYVYESATALHERGPAGTGLHVRKGDPAKEIAQLAAEVDADMIVVGSHRHPQLRSLFFGSTAGKLMAAAKCPVFVAGPRPVPEPSHVIVIEGPCPDCVARREETHGNEWWCARHAEHHHVLGHHRYSYSREWPFADHDSEVTPTGTD